MNAVVRPGPGAPRPYRLPAFSRSTLPNGVEVLIAPFYRLPVVTIRVVVEAGATADSPGRAGEAWLTAKSLAEGTHGHNADEIILGIERLGGELEPETDWNDISVSTTIRSTSAADALALMSELVCTPLFPEAGVARNRSEQIAEREQARLDPRQHADEMFAHVAYDHRARFALPEAGEIATIHKFDHTTAHAFHRASFGPEQTCVIVVGAVDHDTTLAQVGDSLGTWDGGGAVHSADNVDRPAEHTAVHVVDRSGASQTELRLGHVGIPRLHPDYFAAVAMNSVLGGLFSSRINLNLREKHGFTYGAFSAFDWRVQSGPFMISTAVQTDATAPAIREILAEIERMREARISEEERSLAVNFLAGVFPIRYETTAAIAAGLAAMRVFGLPADYFETYRERVLAVTADDVLGVAQRHLHPTKLQILALGDARAIETQLPSLQRDVRRLNPS